MKLFITISKFVSFFYFLIKYQNLSLAFFLSRSHVTPQATYNIKRRGDTLVFTKTGNTINIKEIYVYKKYVKSLFTVLNDRNVQTPRIVPKAALH